MGDRVSQCREALAAAESLLEASRAGVAGMVVRDGRIDAVALEREQFAVHGFAWAATYVESLRQMLGWAERCKADGLFGELESLMLQAAFGEYCAQLAGGIALSQVEIARPADMGVPEDAVEAFRSATTEIVAEGNTAAVRQRIADVIADGHFGEAALGDETLEMVRDQFRRFSEEQVAPHCHDWHKQDVLIPIGIIEQLSDLGVFGLTVPEEFGGLDMGKAAMCVVTEELARGYIGVGSLGTRSEIAAELIRLGGTDAQKAKWLPLIASGEILPTAVFTEPGTGSDLGALKTRAVRDGEVYRITGAKTWITHAARSDIMTLLARTDPTVKDHRGRKAARHRRRPVPRRRHERHGNPRARLPRHEGI
jgi:(2S)-methylsuccinyl-CoA dehydrogenase